MYGLPDKPLNEVGVNAMFGIDLGDILQHIVLGTTTWARSYLGSSAQGDQNHEGFNETLRRTWSDIAQHIASTADPIIVQQYCLEHVLNVIVVESTQF